MAIQQIPRTYGGKDYIISIGQDEDDDSVLYMDAAEADVVTGQPVRYYPDKLTVIFDKSKGKGGTAYIYTEWEQGLIGLSGDPIPNKDYYKPNMRTNEPDEKNFIGGFGMPILMSMANGFVRAILGFNNLPPFNPATGAVLTYTAEQEAAEPTNDYHPIVIADEPGQDTASI